MTSKLLLSLSFLSVVFSINAGFAPTNIAEMYQAQENYAGATASKRYFAELFAPCKYGMMALGGKIASAVKNPALIVPAVATTVLAGSTAVIGSVVYKHVNKPSAVESKPTYLQQAKNYAHNTKVAVIEGAQKVQTAVVNGYDVAKQYTMDKPYHVAAGAAASVAALYAAYAWYKQEPDLN